MDDVSEGRTDRLVRKYREAYGYISTDEVEEPANPEAFGRTLDFLRVLFDAAPDPFPKPYLCDSYDGGVDVVWKNKHRCAIVFIPPPGTIISAAVCGFPELSERKEFADGVVDEDLLRWIRYTPPVSEVA